MSRVTLHPHIVTLPHHDVLDDLEHGLRYSCGTTAPHISGPYPPSTIFKIGFCNKDLPSNLANYMNKFDCVIVDDGPMAPVGDLLEGVLMA